MSETPEEQAAKDAEAQAAQAEAKAQAEAERLAEEKHKADANAASGIPTAAQPVEAVKDPSPGLDVGQDEVQAKMDLHTEQGFIGQTPDPTPNENYSMETPPDAPTPETDPELRAAAQAASTGNALVNTSTPSTTTAPHNQGGSQ